MANQVCARKRHENSPIKGASSCTVETDDTDMTMKNTHRVGWSANWLEYQEYA